MVGNDGVASNSLERSISIIVVSHGVYSVFVCVFFGLLLIITKGEGIVQGQSTTGQKRRDTLVLRRPASGKPEMEKNRARDDSDVAATHITACLPRYTLGMR